MVADFRLIALDDRNTYIKPISGIIRFMIRFILDFSLVERRSVPYTHREKTWRETVGIVAIE